jgi:hypothetical protein
MKREDLKGIVIHCKTEQEAIKCCELADKMGYRWANDRRFITDNRWEMFKERTCYNFYEGAYWSEQSYITYSDYTIKPSEWFLENFGTIKEEQLEILDNALIIKDIDWEQRKWELAKELFVSFDSKSVCVAIGLADKFINEYKKR